MQRGPNNNNYAQSGVSNYTGAESEIVMNRVNAGDDMSAAVREVEDFSEEQNEMKHGGPDQLSLYDDQIGHSNQGYQYDQDQEEKKKMGKSSTEQ